MGSFTCLALQLKVGCEWTRVLNEFDIPVIDGGGRGKDCKKRTVKRVSKEVLVFLFYITLQVSWAMEVTPG